MKTSKLFFMSMAVVLFAAGACNKDDDTETTTTPAIVLDSDTVEIGTIETTESVGYSVTNAVEGEELTATVEDEDDWLTVVEVADSSLVLKVTTNDTKEDRSATVTLSYSEADTVSLTVTQVVPVIVVDSLVSVSYAGGTESFSFSVTNPVEGEVTVSATTGIVQSASVDNSSSTVTLTIEENTGQTEENGTVTLSYPYAKDVEVLVVQSGAPKGTYEDFLGTWTVTDLYGTQTTITISQDVANQSYTISGWQFDGQVSTFEDLGYTETTSTAFPASYNSSTKNLDITPRYLGTATDADKTGELYISGLVQDGSTYTAATGTTYTAATITMTSANDAVMEGGSTTLSTGTYDIAALQYIWVYNNEGYGWSENGTFLPCTLTKVVDTGTGTSSYTPSAKSSKKPVTVIKKVKLMESL